MKGFANWVHVGIYALDERGYYNLFYYEATGRKFRPISQELLDTLEWDNPHQAIKRQLARERQHRKTPGYRTRRRST